MTMALCLNCGATKFGAFNPCPSCQFGSTGNPMLDIAFSDHYLSLTTLEDFGAVIQHLREVCADDEVRAWVFVYYVSENYPSLLSVDISPEMRVKVEQILAQTVLPPVTVTPATRKQRMVASEEPQDESE